MERQMVPHDGNSAFGLVALALNEVIAFFFFQAEDGIRDLRSDWSSDVCSSDLLWVKHYGLGTIIGQPTAGTNGNINMIGLPVGKLVFTGLKVEFPDGTQHFARGVLPDIEVKQTVEAFREGRDLQLEKAVEFLSKIIIAE